MLRQSSGGRNQRSKGIKLKHGVQICLLIAICFWLIYQVKHSGNKKKQFAENDAKISLNSANVNEVLRLGRKDLHTQLEETTQNKDHEEEENNHETEQEEDEGRGGGDDEIDEADQEKSDSEDEHEEVPVDEDRVDQVENESSLEHDHGAREEHYRGDDASSAVTHDTSTHQDVGNHNSEDENRTKKTFGINVDRNPTELKVENSEITGNGTAIEEKDSGIVLSNDLPKQSMNSSEVGNTYSGEAIEGEKSSNSSSYWDKVSDQSAAKTEEHSGSLKSEVSTEADEVQRDPIDSSNSSITVGKKEVHAELNSLSEIRK